MARWRVIFPPLSNSHRNLIHAYYSSSEFFVQVLSLWRTTVSFHVPYRCCCVAAWLCMVVFVYACVSRGGVFWGGFGKWVVGVSMIGLGRVLFKMVSELQFFLRKNPYLNLLMPSLLLASKWFLFRFSSAEVFALWYPSSAICSFICIVMMMAHSSQTRIVGRLIVNSYMLVGGCRDRFLMRTPCRTLNRRRFGMRIVGMLLALSASCVFPLRLYASLPRTHNYPDMTC